LLQFVLPVWSMLACLKDLADEIQVLIFLVGR
jgi:hypothetical protein